MSISQYDFDRMQARVHSHKAKVATVQKCSENEIPSFGMVGREGDLHNAIIAHCRSKGWIYFHGSMAHRAMRVIGEPDFTILANGGRVFFVECKTAKGKLSPQQLAMKVWGEKLEHTIHIVRTMEEFIKIVT
jgi:D-serine deaminase-like pyridoxal phosphate-dependent protein